MPYYQSFVKVNTKCFTATTTYPSHPSVTRRQDKDIELQVLSRMFFLDKDYLIGKLPDIYYLQPYLFLSSVRFSLQTLNQPTNLLSIIHTTSTLLMLSILDTLAKFLSIITDNSEVKISADVLW